MIDTRNIQFATILTELSDHQLTHKMSQEYDIVKLTIMNIGRENTLAQGDDPDTFTQQMGALTLLMMASKWAIEAGLVELS
jgi:hypothetical protein